MDFSELTVGTMSEKVKLILNSEPNENLESKKVEKLIEIVREPLTKEEMECAEKLLMLFAMVDTWKVYNDKKLTSLLPFVENFVIYTRGRVGEVSIKRILGVDKLPILTYKSRVSWLLMFRAHTEDTGLDHRGPAATLTKSRSGA